MPVPPNVLGHMIAARFNARDARRLLEATEVFAGSPLLARVKETELAAAAAVREAEAIGRRERFMAIMRGEVDPYVGEGADGFRRTAQVCRDERDTLDRSDPRWAHLDAEAEAWEQAAMRASA